MKRNRFILPDPNMKALMQEIKEARIKATMELLQKAGIKYVQKTGSILMPLSVGQAKAMKKNNLSDDQQSNLFIQTGLNGSGSDSASSS